jgi:hypothetical protein
MSKMSAGSAANPPAWTHVPPIPVRCMSIKNPERMPGSSTRICVSDVNNVSKLARKSFISRDRGMILKMMSVLNVICVMATRSALSFAPMARFSIKPRNPA